MEILVGRSGENMRYYVREVIGVKDGLYQFKIWSFKSIVDARKKSIQLHKARTTGNYIYLDKDGLKYAGAVVEDTDYYNGGKIYTWYSNTTPQTRFRLNLDGTRKK